MREIKFNKSLTILKKSLAIALTLVLSFSLLTGCAQGERNFEKFSILCVGFAEYDWTLNILGNLKDEVEIQYLLDGGVDVHSYQPSTADIVNLNMANVVIYSGGTSEKWIDAIAKEREQSDDLYTINLMDVLEDKLLEEELVEGMQEEDEEEEEGEMDEHIWLSLRNAEECCNGITKVLCEADSQRATQYEENCSEYIAKLKKIDEEMLKVSKNAPKDTVVFGDRFPFRYLMEDYDLNYYAAFPGCSADSEASFDTIIFLAEKCDLIDANVVIRLEGPDIAIAKAVSENANAKPKIKVMNSMQSVSKKDIAEGATYIGIMKSNLAVLKAALN